ncbi:LLM class flavin-dependent oxidoreductase [Lysinibacillus sp. NPDC097195]|uniref:LLM class flavin-dependent oxidoreductase n=1 Tax=Lysinibacillus sp. NPDC097195 TaxID=3364141 RepID=UPI003822E4DE
MEFGVYTLADIGQNPLNGHTLSVKERLDEVMQYGQLADEVGLQVFGVGEHHRLDYAVSAVPVVLSALSQRTKSIHLMSTTTVLSTVDPVRLYEDFATLDLLSNGRAEIVAGRGAFIESFPLFGYDIDNYDALFEENLALLLKLNKEERVTWSGLYRTSLQNADIAPRASREIPIHVGVGGTPESAMRAGRHGVGLNLAILGGDPIRFKHLVDVYREALHHAGHDVHTAKITVSGHAYFADSLAQAKEEFYPHYSNYWHYVNAQRGMRYHLSKEGFDNMTAGQNALFVGSPNEIIEKILMQYELFGHSRFMAQLDIGAVPFKQVAKSIELLGTQIMPAVNKALKQ